MTDSTFSVASGGNDGSSEHDGTLFNNSASQHLIGRSATSPRRMFFRFENVTITNSSTISSATLDVFSGNSRSGAPVNLIIHCEAADDPAAPSDGTDLISRPLTTGTAWSSVPAMTNFVQYSSVDISSELQEVVDRGGWVTGQAITVHVLDNTSGLNDHRYFMAYEFPTAGDYAADLSVSYIEGTDTVAVVDSFGISDEVDAFNTTSLLSDSFGVSDQVDATLMAGDVADEFGFSDTVDAGFEYPRDFADSFGYSDEVEGFLEVLTDFGDSFGFTDEVDAFNYSAWLRENRGRTKQRFFFTLTGDADSTTDVEIPASSIYARKRSGNPTYLQVTIPSFNYAAQISTRSNGTMIVEIAYVVEGEISLRERILEAELEDISTYEGANSRSIILSGHKTVEYGSQLISIDKSLMSYRGYQSKSRNLRFAIIDAYLNPSDTLVSGDDTLTVGNIVYIINAESTSMEVSEAS